MHVGPGNGELTEHVNQPPRHPPRSLGAIRLLADDFV